MEELFGNELVALLNYKATSNDGKHVMAPFMKIFDDFLKFFYQKLEEFKGELRSISENKDEQIGSLETEVKSLKKLLIAQEDKHDELNQYGRRESLVFSGDSVPEPNRTSWFGCSDNPRQNINRSQIGPQTKQC